MSITVCYCGHAKYRHSRAIGCWFSTCDCRKFNKRVIKKLEPGEWRDGAGKIWTEQWAVVLIEPPEERGPAIHSYGSIVGTRELAQKLLKQIASTWGQGKRLAVVQIFEPKIIQNDATITW